MLLLPLEAPPIRPLWAPLMSLLDLVIYSNSSLHHSAISDEMSYRNRLRRDLPASHLQSTERTSCIVSKQRTRHLTVSKSDLTASKPFYNLQIPPTKLRYNKICGFYEYNTFFERLFLSAPSKPLRLSAVLSNLESLRNSLTL